MEKGAAEAGIVFAAFAFCEGSCGSVSVVMLVESCSSDLASVASG